jgi:cytochrome c-type biogenesis protein CcmH
MKKIVLGIFLFMSAASALAAMPDERLVDPALEARAQTLTQELRCMVCQNQSIEDSEAPLARDLRKLVREQVTAGKSNEDIRNFLVARYGEFILLKPALRPGTYPLWFMPLLILAAGLAAAFRLFRRRG